MYVYVCMIYASVCVHMYMYISLLYVVQIINYTLPFQFGDARAWFCVYFVQLITLCILIYLS